MSNVVKFYGGPVHGEVRAIRDHEYRVDAMSFGWPVRRRAMYDPFYLGPPIQDEDLTRWTYLVEMYRERRGNMHRMMKIAVLEGAKNLLPREEHELRRDMDKIAWEPVRTPRFLTEFERWYNVTMYKLTGRDEFIQEEFRQP